MRRLFLSFVLALALSALGATPALAQRHHEGKGAPEGAQKAPMFGPNVEQSGFTCEGGANPTPKTFGFVVLNTPGNDTTLSGELALKRAAPNTTYEVATEQSVVSPSCVSIPTIVGTLTTNAKGNGNLHFTTERITEATKFWLVAPNATHTEFYGSSAVELD